MSIVEVQSCASGVYDCALPELGSIGVDTCAPYHGLYPDSKGNVALLTLGAVVMALMSFCIGGNDAANSWGTAVGSGAIPLRRAVFLGGFAEWLGATLLGYGVSKTIQKGVADIEHPECWACGLCDSEMPVYTHGMLGALLGASVFLTLAIFGRVPVSTTHAVVGGVAGMTVAGTSASCLSWGSPLGGGGLSAIVASWVISPLLSGLLALAIFTSTERLTFRTRRPLLNALRLLPVLYAFSTFIMAQLVLLKSKPTKDLGAGVRVGAAFALAALVYALVRWRNVPAVRTARASAEGDNASRAGRRVAAARVGMERSGAELGAARGREKTLMPPELSTSSRRGSLVDGSTPPAGALTVDAPVAAEAADGVDEAQSRGGLPLPSADASRTVEMGIQSVGVPQGPHADRVVASKKREEAVVVFQELLVFVAFLESFAHGANDTANGGGAPRAHERPSL